MKTLVSEKNVVVYNVILKSISCLVRVRCANVGCQYVVGNNVVSM